MPRPSFFLVGNPKGGTSALYQFLKAHPGVFMCQPKEPKYFAKDFYRTAPGRRTYPVATEAAYLGLFRHAGPNQLCGEASTWYLYSRVAAQEIHAFDPEARIIAMLREPVDFLYSYYLQLRKSPVTEGERVKGFRKALALEPERRQGQKIPRGCLLPEFLYYTERVKYAEQLERFLAYFDRSQVMVILYDDFKRDNEQVYRDVLAFLGLDPQFKPVFQAHNEGIVVRSTMLHRFVRMLTFGRGWAAPLKALWQRMIPARFRRRLKGLVYRRMIFKPKERLDASFVRELKQQFRPEVEKLAALLDRDLIALWNYDT